MRLSGCVHRSLAVLLNVKVGKFLHFVRVPFKKSSKHIRFLNRFECLTNYDLCFVWIFHLPFNSVSSTHLEMAYCLSHNPPVPCPGIFTVILASIFTTQILPCGKSCTFMQNCGDIFLFSQVSRLKYPGMVVLGGDTTLTNSSTGPNINMVVSRDPDMTALWRLVTPQILGLTNSPLETAFLLG